MTPETPTEPYNSEPFRHRMVTIPNLICMIRFLGSIGMLWLACLNLARSFALAFTLLSLSDTIDGRLARWLNQRSDFGARLDSFVDSVLYACLFVGMFWLRWDVLKSEAPWWVAAWLSYVITTAAGLWKYGRIPCYHTYGAKTTQWLVLAGALCLLLNISVWPFRVAMLAVILTNLEATAITCCLKEWRADVLTLRHVLPGGRCPKTIDPESRK
jgi:cardiolipin synthase (CMP-forming)